MADLSPIRNLKLIVEYDGTAYVGWQLQADLPTVQGALARAIQRMTGEAPTLIVAGRTDAGVHALGQTTNFKTHSRTEARRFVPGLNALLPRDISVHEATEVPLTFDARHDSVSKRYRYRIYTAAHRAAHEENRAWQLRRTLDLEAMQVAAAHLVGEHDFNAFRSVECDAPHARRAMYAIDITRTLRPPVGSVIEIVFFANAFCRHMCRILAGTLVEVGIGKRTPDNMLELLTLRERTLAGVTAPPCGLTLLEVHYP